MTIILRRLYLSFNRHKNYQFPVDYQQTWGSLDRAGHEVQVDMSAKVLFLSLSRYDDPTVSRFHKMHFPID